ncbi:hypothetical protein BG011_005182 [Mortierella polycephala]|uniref:Uncharacterized protein n=1 Tax=Mortierella polycephala TaxID=41804 RepID=A0A9P6U1N8_9FUNG|nr:hypothetical protein BG011_005182 [Mortierella polycephala]
MKFSSSILLLSAAIATIVSAAPLAVNVDTAPILNRHCMECTHKDVAALRVFTKASADHYARITQVHLDNLLQGILTTAKADDRSALIAATVKINIDKAKEACTSEELMPVIEDTIAANVNFDIPWSKEEEIKKKIDKLDASFTQVVVSRIQNIVNAEILSKDCTEELTNPKIVPAPEIPSESDPGTLAPVLEIAASVPETAAPMVETPKAEESPASDKGGLQAGIDVATNIDPKFVCKTGCKDANDAETVLSIRVNLENAFAPRLDHFYQQEVPTACTEERQALLDGVLNLLLNLNAKN